MAGPVGNPVLKALDVAKTQAYHFKAIIIAGMGFFTDSYDLFVISILTKLLGRIYYYDPTLVKPKPGTLPINVNAAVVGTALCGTLVGQLFFGWAGDRFGRKTIYGFTLALMIVTSLGQGLSIGHSPTAVLATLCFFRFWLGFGIGGDYPLSATIMSEYSNTKTRGMFVAAVFAMQGVGILAGGAVTLTFSAIFRHAYYRPSFEAAEQITKLRGFDVSTPHQADWVWRLVLMFGAIPAAMTYYSRAQLPETARYTALIRKNQKQATLDMEQVLNTHFDEVEPVTKQPSDEYGLFSPEFNRRHGRELLGTCISWFLLDIAFYSGNLFQGPVFTAVGWLPRAASMNALDETFRTARAQALLALFSTVPGYWFTVALIDIVGRKLIQMMGFAMTSIFLYIIAFEVNNLSKKPSKEDPTQLVGGNPLAFVVLYGFTLFFYNFGANTTTFIIPAELFPARLRSTCHGISSAAGKAGAIVGSFGFLYASQSPHEPYVRGTGYPTGIGFKLTFLLVAITSTAGFFTTLVCIPETKGKSLETLSGEDDGTNTDGFDNNGVMA